MVFDPTLFLESLKFPFFIMFLAFTALFSLFSVLLFFLRTDVCCDCDTCRSLVTSSWSSEFDNLSDWFTHLLSKSPTQTVHLHVTGNIITANTDNVEYMLKTRFDNYPKGKPFSTILGDLLGHGIFNVDGEKWRFQRKMAGMELGSLSIRSYAFEIATKEISHRLVPLLTSFADSSTNLDLQDVFRRFSFDNICRFSFGVDPGCLELSLPISKFSVAFDLATKLSAERALLLSPLIWKIKRLLNVGTKKKLKDAIKMVNDLATEVIRQKRKLGVNVQQDLLSRFMSTVDYDEKYLRDIVVSFILAGRDTVASSLTSFFWLISQHPEVETAIINESNNIMGHSQEVASFAQLRDMPYLQAATYECLRLFPPVQFDSKFALEDDVLPDSTFVRKGARVTYHAYAMGRMEELWGSDCLEFKPERWLKNGVFTPESPLKYTVFHAGQRVCLGKEMALVDIKIVALSLIRKFKIQMADPNWKPKFAPGLAASMRGGLPVVIRKQTIL